MFSCEHFKLEPWLPFEDFTNCLIPNREGQIFVNTILLNSVDLDRGMIGSRTKQMPLVQISRVNEGAGINYERAATSRDFDA